MSKTFLDLQNMVGDWLNKDLIQLPAAVRKDIINMAQDHICEDGDWTWTQKSTTGSPTILSGTSSIAIPSDVLKLIRVDYFSPDDGSQTILQPWPDPNSILEAFPYTTTTAYPTDFCTWGRNIVVQQPVSADIPLNLTYYGQLDELVNDTDHNFLTDNAWKLLFYKSLVDAVKYTFEEDPRMPVWAAAYEEELQAVRSWDEDLRISSGYLDTVEPGGNVKMPPWGS